MEFPRWKEEKEVENDSLVQYSFKNMSNLLVIDHQILVVFLWWWWWWWWCLIRGAEYSGGIQGG